MVERFSYRPYLDGLRGISVVIVVLFHTKVSFFREGFLGVDVFFVLSGYLITSIILVEMGKKGTFSLIRFYARRARRILPAAAIGVVIISLYFRMVDEREAISSKKCLIAAATYWANQCFMVEETDYWVNGSTSPVKHYWSLSIEEQFYLIYPFSLLILIQMTRVLFWVLEKLHISKFTTKERLTKYVMLLFIFSMVILSLVYTVYLSLFCTLTESHMSSFGRVYQLLSGGVLGLILNLQSDSESTNSILCIRVYRTLSLFVLLQMSILLIFPIFLPSFSLYPPYSGMIMTVLVIVVILLVEIETRSSSTLVDSNIPINSSIATRILSFPIFVYLGKWSYSIYLWHFPLITFGDDLVIIPSVLGSFWEVVARVFLVFFGSLLVGFLSYNVIENPFRKIKIEEKTKRRVVASMGIIIPLTTALLLFFVLANTNSHGIDLQNSPLVEVVPVHYKNKTKHSSSQHHNETTPLIHSLNETDFNRTNILNGTANNSTHVDEDAEEEVFIGKRVFLFGDSQIRQMQKMWESLQKSYGFSMRIHWMAGFPGYLPNWDYKHMRFNNWWYRVDVLPKYVEDFNPDLIIMLSYTAMSPCLAGGKNWVGGNLCSASLYYDVDPNYDYDDFEKRVCPKMKEWMITKLDTTGKIPVVQITAPPDPNWWWGKDAESQVACSKRKKKDCNKPLFHRKTYSHLLNCYDSMKKERQGIFKIVNLDDIVCPNKICPVYNKGVVTFKDGHGHVDEKVWEKNANEVIQKFAESNIFFEKDENPSVYKSCCSDYCIH